MNWTTAKLASESIALLVVAGCAVYAVHDLHQTQIQARGTLSSLNQTVDLINQPCGKGKPCGTLANINKVIVKTGDAIVTTQLMERKIPPSVLALMASFRTIPPEANKTFAAATETAHSASGAFAEAKVTIHDVQPVLASLKADGDAAKVAMDKFSALLDSPDVLGTLHGTNETMTHVAGITGSLDKMGAHLEKKVDAPPTWKSRVQEWLVPSAKIGIWYVTK